MSTIRKDLKKGIEDFADSFRDQNKDVLKYESRLGINKTTGESKDKGYSKRKVSDRDLFKDNE